MPIASGIVKTVNRSAGVSAKAGTPSCRVAAMIRPGVDRRREDIAPDVRTAIRNAYLAGRWPMYFYGRPGRGKTCAALCLLDVVGGFYFTLDRLAEAAFDPLDCEPWRAVGQAKLLVVDELGCRSRDTDREYQAIKRVADIRGRAPLVWVSNLAPRALADVFDDRIASRLACGAMIAFGGPDRRFATEGQA